MTGDLEDIESDSPRSGRWSDEEIAHLRRWYGRKDDAFIARELRRSPDSVARMAREVFDEPHRDGPWSDEEIASLKQFLGAVDLDMIGRMIGRSRESIDDKIVELSQGLRESVLGGEELVRFKRIYGTRTDEDLALIFERRVEVIEDLAATLCLSKDKAFLRRTSGGASKTRMPRWTADELELLAEYYPAHSNLEIAQRLGRSVKSVVSKAHNMGLKKDKARLRQMGRQNVRRRYDRG